MNPLTIAEIRGSICNSSKSRVKSMTIPQDLVEQPWDDLDFLGWVEGVHRAGPHAVGPGFANWMIELLSSWVRGKLLPAVCAG